MCINNANLFFWRMLNISIIVLGNNRYRFRFKLQKSYKYYNRNNYGQERVKSSLLMHNNWTTFECTKRRRRGLLSLREKYYFWGGSSCFITMILHASVMKCILNMQCNAKNKWFKYLSNMLHLQLLPRYLTTKLHWKKIYKN